MDFNVRLLTQKNVVISSLLVDNYRTLKLSDSEFMLIIHIMNFQTKGIEFPTFKEISDKMSISEDVCMEMFMSLLSKGYVQIDNYTNDFNVICEKYNFSPLYTMLAFQLEKEEVDAQKAESAKNNENLYPIFEQEFGRPLSPIEIEILRQWLEVDHHSPDVIKAALKESVIAQALNFKYLERILFDWGKKGITSGEEALIEAEKFRTGQKKSKNSNDDAISMPFVDWAK